MLLILFGLSGSGKNYVGRMLRDEYGMYFYDADTDLTPEMRDAIRNQQIIPDAVRDTFFQQVVERIGQLRMREANLVVSQAIYKEKHRELILRNFPDAQFIWIKAPLDVIMERLARRTDNPSTLTYAEKILSIFEQPRIRHFVLDNADGTDEVKRQIEQILATLKSV
jgi:gluconokinase